MLVLQFNEVNQEAIVRPMNMSTRLDVLKKVELVRTNSQKKKAKELSKLMDHLKGCVGEWNIAIHGLWGPAT
jgi:hypothetical protein